MAHVDKAEISAELDMEFFFERESLAYRMGRGASGMQINAKNCPACGSHKWRVYINADSGLGNCFVCNTTFNKLSFIHAHFGHCDNQWRDTFEACREVLKEQGWRPKRTVTAAVDPGTVKLPYSYPLPMPSGENLAYLEQRGFDGDLVKYFHLRWCEFGWWDAVGDDGKKWQQRFDDRVIVPVYDLDGTLVTFQGRDITGKADKKYLFPLGLPGTGRFLLNGQNVMLTKEVAMAEGIFDVMALKLAFDEEVGLRHVVPVGSFGKHLSYGSGDGNDQLARFIKLKDMGVQIVTIMWDGEEKALIAALNAAKLLTGIGLKVKIALLPPGKDPNEILPEVARRAYWEARPYTAKLDVQWRLRNPYSAKNVGKSFQSLLTE